MNLHERNISSLNNNVLAFTSILDAFSAKTLANPAGISLTAPGKFFAGFAMIRKKDSVGMNSSTPVRTHSISGLKSRVMKLSFLSLKMMVKSDLEFILKLTEPLQRYLLSCQANSANLGRYFCTGQQQL